MTKSYVAQAVATLCAQQNGLLVVQLPSDLAVRFAEEMVREANRARPTQPPYSILIGETDDLSDPSVPRVSRTNAIRYRKGDRLACVSGNGVDLQSFDGSYRQALGPGFPRQQSNILSLENLGNGLLTLIQDQIDTVIENGVRAECASILSVAMETVADAYENSPEITESWNTIWYHHVDDAIASLLSQLRAAEDQPGSESFGHAFARRAWTAFGLPQPAPARGWGTTAASKQFVKALNDWWGDGSQIEVTLAHVRAAEPSVAWDLLDWSSFDRDATIEGSVFRALQKATTRSAEAADAWAAMSRTLFESPIASMEPLYLETVKSVSLSLLGPGSPAVLKLHRNGTWTTDEFVVGIAVEGLTVNEAEQIHLQVTAKPAYVKFKQGGTHVAGNRLMVHGSVEMKARGNLKPIRVTLGVDTSASPQILGRANDRAQVTLSLVPSDVGALAFPRRAQGSLGPALYCGPEKSEEEETVFTLDLTVDQPHLVVVWGGEAESPDVVLTPLPGRDGMAVGECAARASATLTFGEATLQLLSPDGDPQFETPLSAAPFSEPYFQGQPPAEARAMVRGFYEGFVANAAREELRATLGHCVLPSEGDQIADRALAASTTSFVLTPTGFGALWETQTGFSVSRVLAESAECERFTVAMDAILSRLGEPAMWPSKVAWRSLVGDDTELLNEYLEAYADLVIVAREYDNFSRFWACYPFSVSVWDGSQCTSVLLSPLHPLRLAWLASAEATLEDASDAVGLAGVVEGWAFPLIGPSPKPNGRLLAIPSDSGPKEFFAAWSLMVPVSPDEGQPLHSPERIMGQPAPGSSPSGLTASAAEAALRDFQRANPHVPSLTLDLAAAADSPRLAEVDTAVLATIKTWAGQGGLRGVRVLDSLHRAGDLPRKDLSKLIDSGAAVITWSRYKPKAGSMIRSNIRLLQDSGAQLRTKKAALAGDQVAGRLPLRRFSAAELVSENEAFSTTSLAPTGWLAFDRAIAALESTPSRSDLGVKLTQSYILDTGADWTVSGEAFLSPGALGSLIVGQAPNYATKRLLWEWRPPYLQGNHGGYIERRPYVTVARVAPALRKNLVDKLREVAKGKDEDLEQLSFKVLRRLGTRGLGLSSLFTRGDTHESGALGFYLAYELLDRARPLDAIDIVLPLDACDTFLEAMGGAKAGNASKRADVLLVRIRRKSIVMAPIEIKFYGAGGGANHALPNPGAALREAVGQAAATVSSLRSALERGRRAAGTADGELWKTAFATLIESGLRLKDEAHGDGAPSSTEVLQTIIQGTTPIELGRPIVLYFQHGDYIDQGFKSSVAEEAASGQYACLIARPRLVFGAVSDTGDPNTNSDPEEVIQAWTRVLNWATESSIDETSGPDDRAEEARRDPTLAVGPLVPPSREVVVTPPDNVTEKEPPRPHERTTIVGEGIKFELGDYRGGIGQGRPSFWPSNTRLNQMNIGVAGDLGTGKTQLLKALVYRLRHEARVTQPNPVSLLILDYKRDFQDPDFLDSVGGKVLKPEDIPLNPLAIRGDYTERAAYQIAVEFCDVLDRIYAGVGPVQKERLTTTILDLYRERGGQPPTLSSVLERYREDGRPDSVTAILSNFVMRHVFIDGRGPTQSLDELLGDSVVVLAVNEFGNDQDGKNSLVALFLNEYYGYMTRQPKWPYQGHGPQLRRINSYLLVDEAVNILRYDFEVLMNLLLQGREYGVGVVLSSQFLSHFRTRKNDWSEPLLTWFVHKVPSVAGRDLDKVGIRVDERVADAVGSLEVHYALYKGLDEPGRIIRATPFYELARQRGS